MISNVAFFWVCAVRVIGFRIVEVSELLGESAYLYEANH